MQKQTKQMASEQQSIMHILHQCQYVYTTKPLHKRDKQNPNNW